MVGEIMLLKIWSNIYFLMKSFSSLKIKKKLHDYLTMMRYLHIFWWFCIKKIFFIDWIAIEMNWKSCQNKCNRWTIITIKFLAVNKPQLGENKSHFQQGLLVFILHSLRGYPAHTTIQYHLT